MAVALNKESYVNAVIDAKDMTITEFQEDVSQTYNLRRLLDRWDGVAGISLTICCKSPLVSDWRDID